ncbi:sporulation integral membrane protein YlbJ [Paenibacillus yonginensis]|uniref:Sporulation integral membrane protein YlbJ n=1 Tax=Paenibacillus yonginensis TaxID=1462996 RepID=A0A1B1N742_9BACL|nr:sporulation integral membrane protein YlbJ [Paenibacillus yonginensis]ANS77259.1 sporulation integral membrane protein YlbJ [Paenibacillus yonginensis]
MLMLAFPQSSWDAAVRGLSIWWDVLFPSLFPFFVISEVLLGFGIVHFLGRLLDPLMKPLFRIPGSGGFVAAMGFAAGYPVSARLTVKLREQNLISRVEGERLVSFTTSSDPIFLIGAVSVGFFHSPQLAGVLATAHYGGSVIIGLIMRFYRRHDAEQTRQKSEPAAAFSAAKPSETAGDGPAIPRPSRLKSALLAMHEARMADGRELGELLSQAITSSLRLMTVVGGLVVFFSVFLEVLTASGVMSLLYGSLRSLLSVIGLPSALAEPFMSGLFEVTLGAKNAAAAAAGIPLAFKAAAAVFILSWGGLSVHAQVASILNATDLRYLPFLAARFIHAVLSAVLLLLIWPYFGLDETSSAFSSIPSSLPYAWQASAGNFIYATKLLAVMLILSILAILIQKWSFKRRTRRS